MDINAYAHATTEALGDVINIFVLESGLVHAPVRIQKWFEMTPEFQIVDISDHSITVAPVQCADDSERLVLDGVITPEGTIISELQLNMYKECFPKYIGVRYNGGNANSANGGYSVCFWKKRVTRKDAA